MRHIRRWLFHHQPRSWRHRALMRAGLELRGNQQFLALRGLVQALSHPPAGFSPPHAFLDGETAVKFTPIMGTPAWYEARSREIEQLRNAP